MAIGERLDKHDRQVAAIREFLHEGMRLEIETRKDIRAVAAAQKRNKASLAELFNGLKRGTNGHGKGKPDVQ